MKGQGDIMPDDPLWQPSDPREAEMALLRCCFERPKVFEFLFEKREHCYASFESEDGRATFLAIQSLRLLGFEFAYGLLALCLQKLGGSPQQVARILDDMLSQEGNLREGRQCLVRRAVLHLGIQRDAFEMALARAETEWKWQ